MKTSSLQVLFSQSDRILVPQLSRPTKTSETPLLGNETEKVQPVDIRNRVVGEEVEVSCSKVRERIP